MKKTGLVLAACLGAAMVAYLIFYVGVGSVVSVVASLGWGGFALLCCMLIALYALMSFGWFVLLPDSPARRWTTFFWGRAVRDSAGEVLPLSQFGGFVIGARAISLRGVAASDAYASTVVDVTTEMLAQIVFIVVGAILLVKHLGFHGIHSGLFVPLLFGPVLATLGAAGFIVLQRRGPEFAKGLAERVLPRAASHASAFARTIRDIYADPWRIIASTATHFAAWMISAYISWMAVRLIGGHIGYFQMVAIESALSAIRSAAVIVPSAMGVQEVTYAMLMPLFGASIQIGLGLSLIKRACNIAVGVPVLLSWQGLEGRHALAVEPREERLSEN